MGTNLRVLPPSDFSHDLVAVLKSPLNDQVI
jgi:hypothetical protein